MRTKRIAFSDIVIQYPDGEDFEDVWKRLQQYMKVYVDNNGKTGKNTKSIQDKT